MELTQKLYNKMPEEFWLGMRVRVIIEIKNAHSTFPVGTEMTINRKWKGFGLVADFKKTNGCIASISQVSIYEVELIDTLCTTDETEDLK